MAKGKYEEWVNDPDKRLLLTGWARNGLSDEQIAANIGIARSTLNEWKKKYSDISDALKKGKEVADIEVENSLFKRALGYTAQIKKTFKCKEIKYNREGKKVKEEEKLIDGYDEIHVPADTAAIIFWLTNRIPDQWKNRRDKTDLNDIPGAGGVVMLSPVDMTEAAEKIRQYQISGDSEEGNIDEKQEKK